MALHYYKQAKGKGLLKVNKKVEESNLVELTEEEYGVELEKLSAPKHVNKKEDK